MNFFLRILLILLAIASFSSLFSSLYGFLDLFNHFRVQAVMASLALWLISFVFYKRNFIFATVVLMGNLLLFMIPLVRTSGTGAEIENNVTDNLKIVFANINSSNTNYSLAQALLAKDKPDIVALVEVTNQSIENFRTLKALYPHMLECPRSDNFGIAVYSNRPFQAEVMAVGHFELPLAKLNFEGVNLLVAHPFPPISELGLQENKTYLETIARTSLSLKGPLIVAGDFNCTFWGDALTPMIQTGFKRSNGMGIGFTWPVQFPLFAMQIDHIFVRDVAVSDFKILGDIGSDHYPIQAALSVPNKF